MRAVKSTFWFPASDTSLPDPASNVAVLPLPRGLLSEYQDTAWKFARLPGGGNTNIDWSRKFVDQSCLTDPENASLLDHAKRFLTILVNNPGNIVGGSQSIPYALGKTFILLAVFDWVKWLGHSRLNEVTHAEWLRFRGDIKYGLRFASGWRDERLQSTDGSKPLTADRILDVFRTIQSNYVFPRRRVDGRRLMDDGFMFLPFCRSEDPVRIAKGLGRDKGQHPRIPANIACHVLEASIQYIYWYADDLIAMNDRLHEARRKHSAAVTRRPVGQLEIELKRLLLADLKGEAAVTFEPDGRVTRAHVARRLGVYQSSLCKPRIQAIFARFERSVRETKWKDPNPLLIEWSGLQDVASSKLEPTPGEFADLIGLPFSGRSGSVAPWPITAVGSTRRANGLSLERATAHLWTSTYLIIETMVSDRIGEALETQEDCLEEKLDGWYINSVTYKPSNLEQGIRRSKPIPDVTRRAIEVARRLGRNAREETGSTKLFTASHRHGHSVLDDTTVRKRIMEFLADTGCPADETTGGEYVLTPHQLRRLIPVAWPNVHRFPEGFHALQQHLGHEDIQMTIHYAAGDMQKYASDAQDELTASVLEQAALDGVQLGGLNASRWQRLLARLRVTVAAPEAIGEAVRKFQKQKGLKLFPMPWGYCVWWFKAGLAAKCIPPEQRAIGITRPATRKQDAMCAGCANCGITWIFEGYWERAHGRHDALSKRPGVPKILADAARKAVLVAERVIRDLST